MALAALVLSLLTLAPGLDGLLCREDDGLMAVAAERQAGAVTLAAVSADHRDIGAAADGQGVCLYGHCHHTPPCVGDGPAAAAAPVRLAMVDHRLPRTVAPASEPSFGLMRPPRA